MLLLLLLLYCNRCRCACSAARAEAVLAQVLMRPYLVFEDGHTDPNLWGARVADRPPTSSPPLRSLTGGVTMRIYNNGSAIQAGGPEALIPCAEP